MEAILDSVTDLIAGHIRAIDNFPQPGIVFRDITPLLANRRALATAVEALGEPYRDLGVHAVAGMEARGFILGALVAAYLDVGFLPLRKPGKLPFDVHRESYDLEYASTALEMHVDAVRPGDRILLVDDVIATGGTAAASCSLIERAGGELVGCAFLIEIDVLKGRDRLAPHPIHCVIHY